MYDYLKADVKAIIDRIVDELAKDERIGKMYQAGLGTEQSYEEAAAWFAKAVAQNHKYAQYSHGSLYYRGNGVAQDYAKVLRLYDLSASQGNAYAQCALAKLHLAGVDISKNIPGAIRLLTLSAEQKNEFAAYQLGKLYFYDSDVPHDKEKSLYWLGLAAAQGNVYAQFLIENINNPRNPSALLSTTRLLHRLENLFREDYRRSRVNLQWRNHFLNGWSGIWRKRRHGISR